MPYFDDAVSNLATVFIQQGRFHDAERLFQSSLKSVSAYGSIATRDSKLDFTEFAAGASAAPPQQCIADKHQYFHECIALTQNRMLKNEESARSLLHAIHMSPHASIQDWYNVAVVYESAAIVAMKKKQKTVRETIAAIDNIELAKCIFDFLLKNPAVLSYQQQMPIETRYVQAHWNMCTV